jgi:hypothetical protein
MQGIEQEMGVFAELNLSLQGLSAEWIGIGVRIRCQWESIL